MTPQMMAVAPVGHELRAARVAAGLTIEQLAVSAGIGSATVERIEHGRVTPHRSTLLAIALALHNDETAPGRAPFRATSAVVGDGLATA